MQDKSSCRRTCISAAQALVDGHQAQKKLFQTEMTQMRGLGTSLAHVERHAVQLQHKLLQVGLTHSGTAQAAVEQIRPGAQTAVKQTHGHVQGQHRLLQNRHIQGHAAQAAVCRPDTGFQVQHRLPQNINEKVNNIGMQKMHWPGARPGDNCL